MYSNSLSNCLSLRPALSSGDVFEPEFMPNSSQLLYKAKVTEASDVVLSGSDTSSWVNIGEAGSNMTGVSNLPSYNLPQNCNDYATAQEERLTMQGPLAMDGDTGFSMLIGCKSLTNDRYLFGNDNGGGFSIFVRSASINVQLNSKSSTIFRYDHASWGTVKPTGKFIMEITKPVGGGLIKMRLWYWNGSSVTATADSTGNAQVQLSGLAYMNVIGGLTASPTLLHNGEIGTFFYRTKAYETVDSFRDADIAEALIYYPPD